MYLFVLNFLFPGVVEAEVFISDMVDMFFNAWISVMGFKSKHLYCSWHRAWKSNLNKITNKEKRAEVYKIIKTLQLQISKVKFPTALENAIKFMINDKDCFFLGEYSKNTYRQNFQK